MKNSNSETKELRGNCLSFTQVLAQSVASIGPSVGPALGIPLVFSLSGNGTWLTYVFTTIVMLLVGYNINQFAKRSASPGSLYTYVADGLGPTAGVLSGWSLILAYLMLGSACLAGFANYFNVLLKYLNIQLPTLMLIVIGGTMAWYFAFRDVKLTAKIMFVCEVVCISFIIVLFSVVLIKNGSHLDMEQIKLTGISFDSFKTGLVLAFFSFTGFESATALGGEAKNPLKSIPRSLTISILIVGLLFAIFSYTEIMGFRGAPQKLFESNSPLLYLAEKNGIGFMGLVISIGAVVSFWSCTISSITAGARVVFYMGKHGVFHSSISKVHSEHKTPYVSVTLITVILVAIPVIMAFFGSGMFDIFGWLGTIATFGFLFCYALNVIAAPIFLKKNHILKPMNAFISILTALILIVPIVGSVYPVQPFPSNIFPFIFLGWIIVGIIGFWAISKRDKQIVINMKKEISLINKQFEMLSSEEAI